MRTTAALSMLLALLASTTAGAQTRCVVRSAAPRLTDVRVPMPTGAPMTFQVTGADAEATLPLAVGDAVPLVVIGALRFEAEAPSVPFALQRNVEADDAVVRLATSAEVERVHSTPTGEAVFDAVIGASVVVREVQSPCDALRMGPHDPPSHPDVGEQAMSAHPGAPQWTNAHPTMTVFARRASGPSAVVSFARRQENWTDHHPIAEIRRDGAWSQIVLGGEGGVVAGWVEQRALRPFPSTGGGGGSGSSACGGVGGAPRIALNAGDYLGPASIDVGTDVLAAPSGARWATVARPEGFRVLHRSGEAWVRVMEVPNVRGSSVSDRAFVPRSAVHFTAPASP